jgi:uncharacterized membrane protein YcaP (DUF421 family)
MENIIGDANDNLNAAQTILRALIIFFSALVCIRISGMRAFGKNAPLDVVVNIIIGSVLARAIGGHVPFFASIAAAFALALIHRVLAAIATKSDAFSKLIKGRAFLLVKDGQIQEENLRICNLTHGDLHEGIRLNGNLDQVKDVKEAYFERSGQISVIPKENLE